MRDCRTVLGSLFGATVVLQIWFSVPLVTQNLFQGQDPYEPARRQMVQYLAQQWKIKNSRVLKALSQVPRHLFIPEDQRERAYEDTPLPIGLGQTISAPSVVAYMTEQIRPRPTDRVLEVGTGSGYQAAVLSLLVKEVYTIEILPALAEKAKETLKQLGYTNVMVKVGDGFEGWKEMAPFDAIIVTCAAPKVPEPLFEQLKEGGRMILPIGGTLFQRLYLIEKRNGKLIKKPLLPAHFVPMVGKIRK
ncbi:MAG: protein-L-isoaspartate(D-aspartate) O-methyltransferase [Armatimonadetes bacterium]|nr:protein-L-isoaspartate(D-aspartate) O-methyltransferase [Armatimonadota bacterium]MDW8120950.1 protein-L-isoaspartate(D-aspartate) O-methyltransferase [Armatimonadota bacterium]